MNMEWINANDRLPEVECGCGESVLAISNSGEMLELYYDGKCWFGAGGKVRDRKFKITHWMPLPKKPKVTSMERITSNRPWAEAQKNLSNEMGYSHIWTRLNAIENILGEDYDLERLRELVDADREGRCVIIKKCHECKHHHTAYGYHYCRFWHKCCPDDGDFYCQYALKGEAHE